VVHRDLKPANVLLATDGSIKLMDFGLAKPQRGDEDLTQSGATVGSFRYMAPEQILNQPVDARTDLYALGILMYQMTTGTLPFTASSEGGGEFEIMEKQVRQMPEAPQKLNPSLPKAMSDLIMALLAKDPEDRPASCEVVRKALADIARQLEHPSSGPDSNWTHQPGTSQNNVEIAKGLLGAWRRSAMRGLHRLAMLVYRGIWEVPVGFASRWLSGRGMGRFSKPLAWAGILLTLGALGWGLTTLIGLSEHAAREGEKHVRSSLQQAAPASRPHAGAAQHVSVKAGKSGASSPSPVKASTKLVASKSPAKPKPAAKAIGKTGDNKTTATSGKTGVSAKKHRVHKAGKRHPAVKRTHRARRHARLPSRSITFSTPHRLQRSDGSTATGGIHEFRGGHKLYFESLASYKFKDKVRSFKSGWIRLYLKKPVKVSRIVIHRASVGRKSFQGGEIRLDIQDARGHWVTLLTRKDRDIDRPLSLRVRAGQLKGVRMRFKSPEPITIGPVDLLP